MPEVTIREVRIKDARDIAQLSSELGYPTSPEEVRCRIGQMGESSQNAVFVAVTSDDRIIGWVHVFETMRLTSETFAEIGGIIVAEDYKRRGIGKSLLAHAEKWALEKGLEKLRVRSQTPRNDAHSFFINLGFQLSKSQEVFDKPLDP